MSLLQRKNNHKRHLLWVKLVGICLFFHLIFLFWIFCVYRDNSYVLSLSVHKTLDYSAPIMFIPAYVETTADRPLGTQTTTKPIIKKTTPAPSTKVATKTIEAKKPTTVTAASPKITVPAVKKVEQIIAETSKPKTETKKEIEPKKEEAIPKTELTKKEKKTIQEKSSFEPSFAKASEARQAFTTEQSRSIRTNGGDVITPIAQAIDTQQEIAALIPENAYVSNNYRQVEALRMQAQLQKEIVQKWKPPIGVSPECTCDVSFFINTNGAVENIKMVKASGVIMFDISTRQALGAIKMPHWTYGKTLTITFKQ